MKDDESRKYITECKVCGQRYENHSGSTPCCGSVAYLIDPDTGEKTSSIVLNIITKN